MSIARLSAFLILPLLTLASFPGSEMQSNPVIQAAVLYAMSPNQRAFALDAATESVRSGFLSANRVGDSRFAKTIVALDANTGSMAARRSGLFRWSSMAGPSLGAPVTPVYKLCIEKCAPCGSTQLTIQVPPGTSIGPLITWPPFAFTTSADFLTSATRK